MTTAHARSAEDATRSRLPQRCRFTEGASGTFKGVRRRRVLRGPSVVACVASAVVRENCGSSSGRSHGKPRVGYETERMPAVLADVLRIPGTLFHEPDPVRSQEAD